MMPAMPPLMILGRRENCCLATFSEAMTAPCSRMAAMAEVFLEVVMENLLEDWLEELTSSLCLTEFVS